MNLWFVVLKSSLELKLSCQEKYPGIREKLFLYLQIL